MNSIRIPGSIATLVLAFLLSAGVVAQIPSRDVSNFKREMKDDSIAKRRQAVSAIKQHAFSETIKLLAEARIAVDRETDKLRKKAERLRKEIEETIFKRVEKPRMSEGDRQRLRQTVMEQLAEERQTLAKQEQRLEGLEALLVDLRQAMGAVCKRLDDEAAEEAASYLAKTHKKARQPEDRIDMLRVMGSFQHAQVTSALIQAALLGKWPSERVAALNSLVGHPSRDTDETAIAALEDEFWQVRAAALSMLKKVGGKDAIPGLIGHLGVEKGRLKGDLVDTLKALTKADFHDNKTLWRRWWDEHGEAFVGRGPDAGVPGWTDPKATAAKGGQGRGRGRRNPGGGGGGNSFYGIRTEAKDIIYILDVSGSMNGGGAGGRGQGGQPEQAEPGKRKIDRAVRELVRSIQGIPRDGTFNIIFYNDQVFMWQKKMVPANDANKKKAKEWAESVTAQGATNIFDSLERAFEVCGRGSFDKAYTVAAEVIFLLSDGMANRGRLTEPSAMLSEVRKLNELSKVQVNTVAIGRFGGHRFMRRLAQENDGKFVNVE